MDNGRSRRPGSVRQALVPSAFGQVSSPGHVRQSTRAGTCPPWTSDSPTTLTCMLICIRASPASLVCPSTRFFPPRSEEHTSELQSPDHLVCRLLLDITNHHAVHLHSVLHN